jgi:hypothetical protein
MRAAGADALAGSLIATVLFTLQHFATDVPAKSLHQAIGANELASS